MKQAMPTTQKIAYQQTHLLVRAQVFKRKEV